MRAAAEVNKIAILIQGDRFARDIFYEFRLIRLFQFLKQFESIFFFYLLALEFIILFYDVAHLRFYFCEVFRHKGLIFVKIIIEPVFYRRAYAEFRIRPQAFYGLRHHV